MSAHSQATAVPPTTAIRRFALHFIEMCIAMCAGGVILNLAVFAAATSLGYPDLVPQAPQLAILIVAVDLALAMALYMALRGHPMRHNVEMSGSTVAGAIPFIAAVGLGALPQDRLDTWPSLFALMCGPLCLLMLLVMIVRFDHYGGRVRGMAPLGVRSGAGEYTCSMHPEVRLAGPGRCPVCDMRLIRRRR